MLQKNDKNLAVDFNGIKARWGLPDFCHTSSKMILVQSFAALNKINVCMGTDRQQAREEVGGEGCGRLSAGGYDQYFCKHLEDSCCSQNGQNLDGLSESPATEQSSRKLPECFEGISSDYAELLEKKSDQGSKITWENADWLCRPRNYGTNIDLMCNDMIEEREIFDGPLSIHNSDSVCGKYFG